MERVRGHPPQVIEGEVGDHFVRLERSRRAGCWTITDVWLDVIT
jgi:hypothetical protein